VLLLEPPGANEIVMTAAAALLVAGAALLRLGRRPALARR
jgi:hypothetical protein